MPLDEGPEKDPPGALMMLCIGVLAGGIIGHILGVTLGEFPPVRDWTDSVELIPETWKWWVAGEFIGA
ncbi:MAG: hypothetical protein ACYTG4_00815, partial [Planctomycetota bacterium]